MKSLIALVLLARTVPLAGQAPPDYLPHRVYDSKEKRFIDFESMTARLATLDLVFVGEEHDDPATHRMELALLQGIARRRDTGVVVSLEMFERDVQPLLDRYLSGQVAESLFLRSSRPWPRYATDYRGLVELARAKGWPVIAANVPRRLASLVGRGGLMALDTLDAATKTLGARQSRCPLDDDYAESFRAVMKAMPNHGGATTPEESARAIERMYYAQCYKDETMGESVAGVVGPGRLVVHYNGSFHSDFKRGTVERARDRVPGARRAVIAVLPVASLDNLNPKPERKRADYLIYVLKPTPPAEPAGR